MSRRDGILIDTVNHLGPAEYFEAWMPFAVIWIAAISWLVARAAVLFSKPPSDLLETLGNLELVAPEVVIDRLGDTFVSIYWHYRSHTNSRHRRPKMKKHEVSIGGQLIEVSSDSRRLLVTDLKPDTSYKLTLQPVYGTNSDLAKLASANVSKSARMQATVHLHTLSSLNEEVYDPNLITVSSIPTIPAHFDLSVDQIQNAHTILDVQKKVAEVYSQISHEETQFISKSRCLIQKLSELNNKKKEDEHLRAQLRSENKTLEDDDHALEVQVAKLKQYASKLEKYQADWQNSRLKMLEIDRLHVQEKAESERMLDQLETRLHQLKVYESELNETLRNLVQTSRTQDVVNEKVKAVVNKLYSFSQRPVQEKLDLIHSDEAEYLADDQKEKLKQEFLLDDLIDSEWDKAQKALEQRYVDAYSQNSARRKAKSSSYRDHELNSLQFQNKSQNNLDSPICSSRSVRENQVAHPTTREIAPLETLKANIKLIPTIDTNLQSSLPMSKITEITAVGNKESDLHTVASIGSFGSASSIRSRNGISSASIQSFAQRSYDVFSPSSVGSSQKSEINQFEQSLISPTTANDLLPSNLFQDLQPKECNSPINSEAGSEDPRMFQRAAITPEAKLQLRNSGWLPWLNTQNKQSNHFSSPPTSTSIDHKMSESRLKNEDPVDEFENVDTPGVSRSPLKGVSSRFFQKNSTTRSVSFRRRLSLFARKES